ncbi:hypothetical protein V6D40_08825 [Corynebacterium sp. Q4381]|uniref:hypothetical protein n=1 Tax=Corynebacterium sp. Marseille-Q4381 TaxID=3121597 RepID=UPI002FE5F160
MSRARILPAAAVVGTALTLAACGGGSATVDASDATTPATTAPTTSSGGTATVTETSTSKSSSAQAPARAGGPEDQPARDVEEVPAVTSDFSPQERAFLDQLSNNGLNIEGVEDQLTATGLNVCANDMITRDAVAGQLVEQRRTDMTPEALGELITAAARDNLCS